MKRFWTLLTIVIISLSGCGEPAQEVKTSDNTEEQTTESQKKPAAVSENSDYIQENLKKTQELLKKTDALLVKRTAQRDAARTAFKQIIRGKEIAPEEIMAQLRKQTSQLEEFKWFLDAKKEFQKWEMYEKSIIIFTNQKEWLKKDLQSLELALEKKKLNEEDSAAFIKKDSKRDERIVNIEFSLDSDNIEESLSEGEKFEIATQADKSMNEAVKKNVSRITGLTLNSVNELPAFPDIKTLVKEPEDSAMKSLYKRVVIDVNKNIKTAQEKAQKYIDNKKPEFACGIWLQTIEDLKKVIAATKKHNSEIYDDYLKALDECQDSLNLILIKPYAKSLDAGIKSLEGENPDWEMVAESLEGLTNSHPKFSPKMVDNMKKRLEIIHMHTDYLKDLNGFAERVIQQRVETTLESLEKQINLMKAENLYKQADKLRAMGDSDQALKLLEDAISLDPGNKLYSDEKQAIEKRTHKEKADELYNQALSLHSQERYAEAMFKIEEALRMFPDNYMYQIEKSAIEDDQKKANVEDVYNQAVELRRNKKPREALAKINEALEVNPNDSKYLKEKKEIENALNLLDAAELYKQAIELRTQNKPDEALEKINKALEIDRFNTTYQNEKQTIVKLIQSKPGARKVVTVNGVDFAFRWCPPGTFLMGSPEWEKDRDSNETQHEVTLTKGFWIMETEVTQKQWKAILGEGDNPSRFEGDDLPVEQVDWDDIQRFIKKSAFLGFAVDLPTEAQWEYACRAGSTTVFFWGDSLNGDKANCDGRRPYGTRKEGKYLEKTTPVGSYSPNAWGLYDMHGNVWEICKDRHDDYPTEHVTDPIGTRGYYFNSRGGSWDDKSHFCRSGNRGFLYSRNSHTGFRCILAQ